MSHQNIALKVERLKVTFPGGNGEPAVNDVSFSVKQGGTLALIGASGSGKSVTSLALMGLLPKSTSISGSVILPGKGTAANLLQLQPSEWTNIRGKEISMVFQEPMSALNPIMSCGRQLMESIRVHDKLSPKAAKEKAIEWLEKVKLPDPRSMFERYPHQLSGGQKQRVMIAMAMCNHPQLLIADEPTTALDVTVQGEIINLMQQLQQEYGTAMLFITHDLALAKKITRDFIVMNKGKIVDNASWPTLHEAAREGSQSSGNILLTTRNIKVYYPGEKNLLGRSKTVFKAVDDVSFDLYQGETLGLVGESGCGKTTLSRAILGLQQITNGNLIFKGEDITHAGYTKWRELRRDIQIIFQDPYASLNPRIKIGDALAEPIKVHGLAKGQGVEKNVQQLLTQVGLPVNSVNKYPHEFSGGQRQRICIARALAVQPELIICDESVSALDLKIQSQILELLTNLQKEKNLTYLFITHDLNVVRYISNRIMVMQKGKIVEYGDTKQVMDYPQQEYTRKLMEASLT